MKNTFLLIFVLSSLIVTGCTKKESPQEVASLAETLKKKADASAAKAPEAVKATIAKSIRELKESKVLKNALKTGDSIPKFSLPDVKKGNVQSTDLLAKGPIVIVFYRGGWCPYCNLQLRDLQKYLPQFKEAGAELIAISPEKPDATLETVKKQDLGFYVLSDAEGKVGHQFGLMYKLDEDLKALYKKFGIDLTESNANDKWELPLTATYIVDKTGEIVYSFIDVDYKKRAETTDLLEIIKSL